MAYGERGIDRASLVLRGFLHETIKFAGRSLKGSAPKVKPEHARRLKQAQCADSVDIGGMLNRLERQINVSLGSEIVTFHWLRLLHYTNSIRCDGEIAVMYRESATRLVGILIRVVGVLRVAGRGTTRDERRRLCHRRLYIPMQR